MNEPDEREGWRIHPSLEGRPDLQPAPRLPNDSVARGALYVLAGHALGILLIAAFNGSDLAESALLGFFFIGLYQWLYVVPLLIWAYATRRRQMAKGVWILAGVSVLPTVACFGVLTQMQF